MRQAISRVTYTAILAMFAGLTLNGCGGGGSGGSASNTGGSTGTPVTPTFTVGATVSGLNPGTSIILQDNNGDNLTVSSNSTATFATALVNGSAYTVSILTQPSGETCSVTNASGTISSANVSATISCTSNPTPHFAYVTTCNAGGGIGSEPGNGCEILGMSLNATTGSLSQINGDINYPFLGPTNISAQTIDPTGRFLYTINAAYMGPNFIAAYAINPSTGALANINSDITAGLPTAHNSSQSYPQTINVTPSATFALVGEESTQSIVVYAINATTGDLTPVSGSPFVAGTWSQALAINPKLNFVYGITADGTAVQVYAINPATGVLTIVSGSPYTVGTTPQAIAVSPNGNFVYVLNYGSNNVSAFAVNAATGTLTPVSGSPFATGRLPTAIAITPNGNDLYITNSGSTNLFIGSGSVSAFTINGATGALSPISGSPYAMTSPYSVTISQNGLFAYVALPNYANGGVAVYGIDQNTGALTSVGSPVSSPAGYSTYLISTN